MPKWKFPAFSHRPSLAAHIYFTLGGLWMPLVGIWTLILWLRLSTVSDGVLDLEMKPAV